MNVFEVCLLAYLLTTHYPHWHVGQQHRTFTSVCRLWPVSRWYPTCGARPSFLSSTVLRLVTLGPICLKGIVFT